jgi:hypothetical protein
VAGVRLGPPARLGAGRAGAGLSPTHRLVAPAALLAAGLSSWAALTDPFTAGADAVTAVAIALCLAVGARGWRRAPALPDSAMAAAPGRWWPWAILGALVVAFELVTFFLGPRADYPTLSSLYDSAAGLRPVKGAFFLAWLALGAALVRW